MSTKMKISKELKVGIVAVVAMLLLIWGYSYLKGSNLFVKGRSVHAIYPRVTGLSVSAPITINGVQSGIVESIYFHPDKSSRVIVKLRITESGLRVPDNSIADLISTDFLGSKAISLKLGDSELELQDGDTILSHFEKSTVANVSEQLLPIKHKTENLVDSLQIAVVNFNAIMESLNGIFDDHNKKQLSSALSNLNKTLKDYDKLAVSMNNTVTTSVEPTLAKFKNLADTLSQLNLKQTLDKTQETMDAMSIVLTKINEGQGTIGKMMNSDELYNNLTISTKELGELLEDIKLNPKRYFRILSRKQIPYKKDTING